MDGVHGSAQTESPARAREGKIEIELKIMEIENISYKNTAFVAQDHGELACALTEALRKRPVHDEAIEHRLTPCVKPGPSVYRLIDNESNFSEGKKAYTE